ncbi:MULTISPECIES: quinone-dependent dihydroorotate dehydrogenase [Halomonadaceae]|uniref:Dihydroorotate dehydrogenase (quinone) n=1 Tax=Vreelandella halophila TaxID=86177 RepID=A0A9X4Y9I8_9GAMM|nr:MULTISPECIES: quinone-dependent dihydroorotate dehydrogenase [Halomonas]MYL25727.1 quinone-dependent dihydroorotate dehydrogenase [Halomonas utahensis]MYL75673.1 quinone-dependent dihydroorotate dehydrogenase [Halomonas sp. 22501_18_FS]
MYQALRPLFFRLPPETAHWLALESARAVAGSGLLGRLWPAPPAAPVEVMGLTLPNPVGLAAGLDKEGRYIDALGELGFGFLEIGTVTPRPQPGNPKPRLFRLPAHEAIINRMGFNNHGLEAMVANIRASRYSGILGINVGRNKDTPADQALDDYLAGIERMWSLADYLTINVSSPNTPGLRDLQHGDALRSLLAGIREKQLALTESMGHYVPIAVKVAPDMDEAAVRFMAETLREVGMDGVIATNTTVDHSAVLRDPLGEETGGLSGRPLAEPSTAVIRQLRAELGVDFPIIGVGGITSSAAALAKIRAGASAVQLYSGLIYRGPHLVADCARAIAGGSGA